MDIKKPEGMHRELWGLLWTDNMYVMFECACILVVLPPY